MSFKTLDQAVQALFPGEQGITQRRGQYGETGVDIGFPTGYNVQAVSAGIYRKDLSTSHQVAIQTPSGLIENYVHIVPTAFKPNEPIDQGEFIGSIYGGPGAYTNPITHQLGTYVGTGPGGTVTYHSGGPHLEFDVAQASAVSKPWDFFNLSKTLNPASTLEGQQGVVDQSYHGTAPLQDITVPSGTDVIGAIKGALPALFVGSTVYIIVAILVLVLILRR